MKKTQPQSVLWNRLLVATVMLLVFAGSIGLATVWLRHQVSEVAASHQSAQVRIADIDRRIAEVNAQIAANLSPDVLLRQNTRLSLGLAAPRDTQIVRVDEEVEIRLASKRNAELYTTTLIPASFPVSTPR
jgi:Pyruvate/2-oxoacid:ferredoxin oxidoreductase gamma subunit